MVKTIRAMKKIIYITLAALLAVCCSEVDLLHPYGEDDGKNPGVVTDVQVRNEPGGATIFYSLPKDKDLSYVRATFRGTNGVERNVTASAYVDSLVIEGLGNTNDCFVSLRSYDKHENASDEVKVKITPLTPPIQTVFESLQYHVDFGGFVIDFTNENKADIGIFVTRKNADSNEQEYYDVHYTSMASGSYAVRGLPDDENEFGIYVEDHFGNRSETILFTETPWREDLLDKKLFYSLPYGTIPGDLLSNELDRPMSNLWDGTIDNWNYGHTVWPLPFPHRFTFDLGVTAKLSRIKTWQRSAVDCRWQHGAWKLFKVYGCNEIPADGNADWVLVGDFLSVKPSGLPIGEVSDEDIQLLNDGEEFSFLRDAPAVRYLRFEINGVHSTMQLSCMSEITLWGEIQDADIVE